MTTWSDRWPPRRRARVRQPGHGVLENTASRAGPARRPGRGVQGRALPAARGHPLQTLADALLPMLSPRSVRSRAPRLADVARADRLDELDFELPMLGGETPTGRPRSARSAACWPGTCRPTTCCTVRRRPGRPGTGRPVAARFPRGSIDLVLRVRGATARPGTSSSTTRPTGSAARPCTPATTRRRRWPPRCSTRTTRSRRCSTGVALHRFLRWRQPGYDPRAPPRRHPLPVPARHVRPGHTRRRRRALRRVLAGRRRPRGHRPLGPPATGERSDQTGDRSAATSAIPSASTPPPDCSARSTRPGCSTRPTCTSPTGSVGSAGEADDGCCSRRR